jgi:hypothetical protein
VTRDSTRFRYLGDVEMGRLLAEVACPRPLDECRALLRGAVAAQKTPLPSVLVRELFHGREPHFRNLAQADRFVESLFALLEELTARFSLSAWTQPLGSRGALVGSLEDRAGARCAEVKAFLRGLDLGATDPASLDEAGRDALHALTEAAAYLAAMGGLLRTDAPSAPELATLTDCQLGELEALTADSMQRIEASLRAARAPDGRRLPGSGVGPSDLCTCGSGKPMRRCCGAPV